MNLDLGMGKSRMVFLTGAGSAIPWGGPRTLCHRSEYEIISDIGGEMQSNRPCCLTHLFLVTGFCNTDGERITELVYRRLSRQVECPNFEDIINELEQLAEKYNISPQQNEGFKLEELEERIICSDDIELTHFEIEGNSSPNEYTFSIPGNPFYTISVSARYRPEFIYFRLLIADLLSGIMGHVHKYMTDSRVYGNTNASALNNRFINWLKKIKNEGHTILRFYTLNYDVIFKILAQKSNLPLFDGFEFDSHTGDADLDILRIIKEEDIDCAYNLHGQAFWKLREIGESSYTFYSTPYILYTPDCPTLSKTDLYKYVVINSIVSGHGKVYKTYPHPFRQMLSSFDRDLLKGNELKIIGYSFGDAHINNIILTALAFNSKLVVEVIDTDESIKEKVNKVFTGFSHRFSYIIERFDKYLEDIA